MLNPLRHIIHLLLILSVFIGTNGMPFVLHYCGGTVESVGVFASESCADEEGCDDEGDSCCNDEIVFQQLTVDALQTPAATTLPPIGAVILPAMFLYHDVCAIPHCDYGTALHITYHTPPPLLLSLRC
ncbi:MAG: hypothetical protein JNL32_01105 [Candidatus Kapabacteria bacterium]|nr:hypothetical protein [Candidatus Kapabacteria bacterium]